MSGDSDGSDASAGAGAEPAPRDAAPPARLRRVDGPVEGAEQPPAIRLRREFKGLTVADLLRDEIVERLPGQVRTALQHLQRGDLARAERALPGEFAPILAGPGHRRAGRRWHRFAIGVCAAAAALAGWWWWW